MIGKNRNCMYCPGLRRLPLEGTADRTGSDWIENEGDVLWGVGRMLLEIRGVGKMSILLRNVLCGPKKMTSGRNCES